MDAMVSESYNPAAGRARVRPPRPPPGDDVAKGNGRMRRKIRVVGAMIELDGRYLITQRPPRASLPLLWEFPGGRVEPGETDQGDRKSTRLNSSHNSESRMPSSA
jgi:8-oxo-dGTP pyrophosphatase MutT (NUDIX family)